MPSRPRPISATGLLSQPTYPPSSSLTLTQATSRNAFIARSICLESTANQQLNGFSLARTRQKFSSGTREETVTGKEIANEENQHNRSGSYRPGIGPARFRLQIAAARFGRAAGGAQSRAASAIRSRQAGLHARLRPNKRPRPAL